MLIVSITFVLSKVLTISGEIIIVEANPEKGFNYEYYLCIPKGVEKSKIKYLLVEPNNTGMVSDNHDIHVKKVENLIRRGHPKRIASALTVPLLIPVFDRPENWKNYTHSLDSDTLKINKGQLARIDLQLISMISDAQNRLGKKGLVLEEKIIMHGFSASGSFANRFTALHPEKVKVVVSGGVNCMPIIPSEKWDGIELPFHIGVANIDEIAGIRFNLEEYKKVAQYIYMGEIDDNDTLPFNDAFNEDERQIVIKILGSEMKKRWEKSKEIYNQFGIPAQMVMYKGVGHTITPEVENDIINFFRLNVGDRIDDPKVTAIVKKKEVHPPEKN